MSEDTTTSRELIAELLGKPVDEVRHYAVVAETDIGLAVKFCGMPRNGVLLMASGIAFLTVNGPEMEANKLELGCTACDWPRD